MHDLRFAFFLILFLIATFSCNPDEIDEPLAPVDPTAEEIIRTAFNGRIDLAALDNFANQPVPGYINRDNTASNAITDAGATLGRVLFYDVALSTDRTISCASCHRQQDAFGDPELASTGVAGTTGRHGMRLSNARFGDEPHFFWDERAATLETQTTQPIRDAVEMGFSGENGEPSFADLITRLEGIDYYPPLFEEAFGSTEISEARMQRALAQFIRSLQSFDSRFDEGMAAAPNPGANFANFTAAENRGKALFLQRANFDQDGQRVGGGLGCGSCHQAPEFSIDPNSNHNGVVTTINGGIDRTVTRAPSLRDLFRPDGTQVGPYMHDGSLATLESVLDHYNQIPAPNPDIDRRLAPGNNPQRLQMTIQERTDVVAFLRTLTGRELFEAEKFSTPFE